MSSIFTRGIHVDEETDRLVPAPYAAPRPITAAASRVSIKTKSDRDAIYRKRSDLSWQEEAWFYYDAVGEIKHGALLVGSLLSRVKIFAGYVESDDAPPTTLSAINDLPENLKEASREAIAMLGSGPGGISGLLRDAAINIFISGEFYLVQHRARPGSYEGDYWQIHSVEEVVLPSQTSKEPIYIRPHRNAPKSTYEPLPRSAFVARIWRTHPRFSIQADSSLLGILELLEELLLLSKTSRATIKSRLNNGLLLVPDTISIAYASEEEGDDPEDHGEFEEDLAQQLIEPIADESSASAVVPVIIRGPAAELEKIRHISISRTFDEKHVEQTKSVLERILSSLELPKEAVSGLGTAKYNTASTIEDSLVRNYLEPLILMLADALTTVYLRPVLRAMGFPEKDISRIVVWYDPGAIIAKPSKADAADRGLEYGTISKPAWRRAYGFGESDAPTELEIAQDMAVKRGALSEPVTEALLRTLMPSILEQVDRAMQQQAGDVGQVLDQIEGGEIPEPGQPAPQQQQQAPPALAEPDGAAAPAQTQAPGAQTQAPGAPTNLMEP